MNIDHGWGNYTISCLYNDEVKLEEFRRFHSLKVSGECIDDSCTSSLAKGQESINQTEEVDSNKNFGVIEVDNSLSDKEIGDNEHTPSTKATGKRIRDGAENENQSEDYESQTSTSKLKRIAQVKQEPMD
ncbi:unnamed protein product [Cuscuta epithymum]|uniref:Uncharacterized protein n=1 Tax=Cuscuta epithymum TaxID=186058 RepID=A0AAV0DKC2_9ASTE|nr:unnamed protein product [Cuscuta epithymum]